MTRCKTIDQAILEKTKMDKVLPRLVKRGDDKGKMYAQKILDHAADVSKHRHIGEKPTQSQQLNGSLVKKPPTDSKDPKRERLDNSKSADDSSTKGPSPGGSTKSTTTTDLRQANAKGDVKTTVKSATSDTHNQKVKTTQITAKPSGFFAGLKSASKKPGTSAKLEDGKSR